MPDLWSGLKSPQRVERIMKVMERAGRDPAFRALCVDRDPAVRRNAIEQEAIVTFDAKYVLQCYSDKESAENQIVLLFPDRPTPVTSPVKDYWLCTYVDYVPA